MTVSDTHVCECGHPISSHPGADYGRGSCVATVLTNAPLGGGSTYQCPCKTYSEVTVSDTHADTIRDALFWEPTYKQAKNNGYALAALDALVAEVDRERARAERAEAALREVEITFAAVIVESGGSVTVPERALREDYLLSRLDDPVARTVTYRAALSAGSGGRETTP